MKHVRLKFGNVIGEMECHLERMGGDRWPKKPYNSKSKRSSNEML
jgi:hypothetical protein